MAESILTDPDQAPFVDYKPGAAGDGISTLAGVATRDNTVAGRVRSDPRDATGATLCMTVTADNLRLGAATNAMRIASCWFPSKHPELQAPAVSFSVPKKVDESTMKLLLGTTVVLGAVA